MSVKTKKVKSQHTFVFSSHDPPDNPRGHFLGSTAFTANVIHKGVFTYMFRPFKYTINIAYWLHRPAINYVSASSVPRTVIIQAVEVWFFCKPCNQSR